VLPLVSLLPFTFTATLEAQAGCRICIDPVKVWPHFTVNRVRFSSGKRVSCRTTRPCCSHVTSEGMNSSHRVRIRHEVNGVVVLGMIFHPGATQHQKESVGVE